MYVCMLVYVFVCVCAYMWCICVCMHVCGHRWSEVRAVQGLMGRQCVNNHTAVVAPG